MITPDDDKLMRQYLLGNLPDAETEVCDERSFLDDEFAARLQMIEDDLVDAYVRGELAGEELAQFQTYYLASPRRLERVRFAQSFQPFVEQSQHSIEQKTMSGRPVAIAEVRAQAAEAEPDALEPKEGTTWLKSLLGLFTIPRLNMQWGLAAATLVLLVGVGWLVFESRQLRQQIRQNEADRIALQQRERALETEIAKQQTDRADLEAKLRQAQEERARLEQERERLHQAEPSFAFLLLTPSTRGGGGESKDLKISPAAQTVKLRAEFRSDDYPSYRAELRTQADDQLVWRRERLKARAKNGIKIIDLSLRADLFKAQRYQLHLKGVTASGEEDLPVYSFKVVRK